MMAKEKAEELMSKYYDFANDGRNARFYDSEVWKNNTKECALICVDEIIKSKPIGSSLEYWEEVKQELEKL